MGLAWRILFIESKKLRLDNAEDSKYCRLPLCSNVIGLTLMCWSARAMNNVRLFLTTHPSKVNSRFGTLSDASGPFSLFKTVVEKFLIRMPKNWNEKPWVKFSLFSIGKVLSFTWASIIAVGGRYWRRLFSAFSKKYFVRFATTFSLPFVKTLHSSSFECFRRACASRSTSNDWLILTSSSSMQSGFL